MCDGPMCPQTFESDDFDSRKDLVRSLATSFQESMKELPLSGGDWDAQALSASSAAAHNRCGRHFITLSVADLFGMS